jgi:hypothetical protein
MGRTFPADLIHSIIFLLDYAELEDIFSINILLELHDAISFV